MLKQILENSDIPFTFLGYKAILEMTNGNMAEVTLKQGGTVGYYYGLLVTIVNPIDSTVTTNHFTFEQYLGEKADRSHGNSHMVSKMYIWADKGLDWYIVKPTDFSPIIDAILEFIIMYAKKA